MNHAPLAATLAVRHRLLEGVLLRLARLPHPHAFVLRGGMLMRLWFRPLLRPAKDVDLVATFEFDVEEAGRRLIPLLADRGVDDGVTFDQKRFRLEGIWLQTDHPGVRLYASGGVEGVRDEFTVDVTFSEPLVPAPDVGDYPMETSPHVAQLAMCRPETIISRKLHALFDMGMLHWRPKDLNDLRLLLSRPTLEWAVLPEAIAASFLSRGDAPGKARQLFRQNWWSIKRSAVRWRNFCKDAQGQEVPADLATVVAAVGQHLEAVLEKVQ
jgi:hypothetical protein